MLKRLRFKNWRSLRDVEIDDLTPLTVLIGANSSGKSNIVDGLSFLRRMLRENSPKSIYFQDVELKKAKFIGSGKSESIEVECSIGFPDAPGLLTYTLEMQPKDSDIEFKERLVDSIGGYSLEGVNGRGSITGEKTEQIDFEPTPNESNLMLPYYAPLSFAMGRSRDTTEPAPFKVFEFITQRWQMLNEHFKPEWQKSISEIGDAYVVDPIARNILFMLNFMQHNHQDIYNALQNDLRWLVEHIDEMTVHLTSETEARLLLQEKPLAGKEAPTISGGTSRLIAILTAFYALEMRYAELPGLVVVEEPDMAVHPLLLKSFVELLRTYVEGEHPRQFILTTHNPRLLDFFDPIEVRIVQRDELGHTTVRRVPEHIRDVWLDEHTLGEVWMTRSLGDMD